MTITIPTWGVWVILAAIACVIALRIVSIIFQKKMLEGIDMAGMVDESAKEAMREIGLPVKQGTGEIALLLDSDAVSPERFNTLLSELTDKQIKNLEGNIQAYQQRHREQLEPPSFADVMTAIEADALTAHDILGLAKLYNQPHNKGRRKELTFIAQCKEEEEVKALRDRHTGTIDPTAGVGVEQKSTAEVLRHIQQTIGGASVVDQPRYNDDRVEAIIKAVTSFKSDTSAFEAMQKRCNEDSISWAQCIQLYGDPREWPECNHYWIPEAMDAEGNAIFRKSKKKKGLLIIHADCEHCKEGRLFTEEEWEELHAIPFVDKTDDGENFALAP